MGISLAASPPAATGGMATLVAAMQLDDAQALLRVAAALGRFGAWSVDLERRVITWTDGVDSIQQAPVTRTEPCGEQIFERYVPEHRELLRQAYLRCLQDGTPFDLELQAFTTRGRRLWVRVIGMAVRGLHGEIVRLQGAYQDIQKSKAAAEEERQRAQRMRMTLDSLTDGFMTVDRQWRISYVNPAGQNAVNATAVEILGRSFWEVFPQARNSLFEDNYRQAMDEGVVRRFDAYYAPLDSWFRVSAFPSEQGIALSFTDITAAHHAHERLLQLNAELEQRVQQRTEQLKRTNDELAAFTLAVAHDLRAPLAGIAGFSRAVAERLAGGRDEKTRHFLARIRAGVARMEGLLDALLELARVGRAELEPRRVNVSALALCAVEVLRAQEPGRVAQVEVQDGLAAWGDARLLRTLVENLLGNAWKFSGRERPAEIAVGRRADGAFYVRDNGPGFDMDRVEELFTPFSRLAAEAAPGGRGIGLASARRVVERHGGRIWAESSPGQGTVFCFTLAEGPAAPPAV